MGKINYNDFVRRFLGEREGAIIELEIGKESGHASRLLVPYDGQRKGLGLSGGPWFVIKKDVEENIIYVSHGYGVETRLAVSSVSMISTLLRRIRGKMPERR